MEQRCRLFNLLHGRRGWPKEQKIAAAVENWKILCELKAGRFFSGRGGCFALGNSTWDFTPQFQAG